MMNAGDNSKAIETQPTSALFAPAVYVPDVTVRTLRNTPEDAEFAAKLVVEAFRGKIVHNITERKLPIAVNHMTAQHMGQLPAFYNRTFVAELSGRPVGLLQLKFRGDTEIEKDDHISELGCWHACRYAIFGCCTGAEEVKNFHCYLDHICVDACARGKGIGKVLMERAEFEAKARNCSIIYLYVLTNNPARRLYEREGYSITKTQSCCLGCAIGPPGSVYKMEKNL